MASAPGKIAKKVARSREMRQPQDYSVRPPFPKAALVELANLCNHSCVFCPIEKMTRKGRHIDRQLLERVLLEAYRLGTRELGFYGGSEPFVSKQLEHFIEFSKTTGFEYVYISTNGSIPSKDRMSSVLDSGLDSIKFSVNGGDRESYLAVHGKDDFTTS